MLIFQFLVSFILFLFACLFVFYLPGFLLLRVLRVKLERLEELALSLTVGLVCFTFGSFVLGYLQVRFLALPLLFVLALFQAKTKNEEYAKSLNKYNPPVYKFCPPMVA